MSASEVRVDHFYPVPSRTTVERFIRSLSPIDHAAREGADEVKAALGYIDRTYEDLASLERVDTDEAKIDILSYDLKQLRDRSGKPLVRREWFFSFYDVRSINPLVWDLVLGDKRKPKTGISEEDEIRQLVRLIVEYDVPGAINSDRGRFRGSQFGGRTLDGRRGADFKEADGILDALGIRHNMPREHNPRGSRLERFHRYIADCAREVPGWIGSNTRERKMARGDVDAEQHLAWLSGERRTTPLLNHEQLLDVVAGWIERWRDHPSEGTSMNGLSPRAVFVHNTPPEGFRRVSDEKLAWITARHFQDETIEPGGIVTLPDGKRYSHPLLTLIQGQQRECVLLRHDDSFISVLPTRKGEEAVIAPRRVAVGANDPAGLSAATEFQARLRKLVAQMGVGARHAEPGPNGAN